MLDSNLIKLIRFRDNRIICTGGVVFIGDGNTGKTHTAMNLTSAKGKWYYQREDEIRKSVNLELDYFIFQTEIEEYDITTSSQIFIMPGQKGRADKGVGLALEDAADLFDKASSVRVVVSVILTYNLADTRTFQELEYWLDRAIDRNFLHEFTSLVILGTHLDNKEAIEITAENIEQAKEFTQNYIMAKKGLEIPDDQIYSIEISNTTEEGIDKLKEIINLAFRKAFKIDSLIGTTN